MTTTEDGDNCPGDEFDKVLDETLVNKGVVAPKVTEQDIEFVIEIMKKEAPYDEVSIKQIFYGCNSAFTKLPIHHNINSRKSGAGKSYMLVLVSGYFPNRYVIVFLGMSDKALVHEQGIQVIVDEETGSTILIQPIINNLKLKIDELESQIESVEGPREKRN